MADALASLQRRNAELAAEIANCGLSQTYVAHIKAENALLRKAKREVLRLCEPDDSLNPDDYQSPRIKRVLIAFAEGAASVRKRVLAAYATSQPQENTP